MLPLGLVQEEWAEIFQKETQGRAFQAEERACAKAQRCARAL
jgi:hypothetical protein